MTWTHLLECIPTGDVDFVRGDNCTLWDAAGNRFVDLESGSWASGLGHGHPRILRALTEQAARLQHLNVRYPSALVDQAAGAVLEATGLGDGRCVFLSSGSEAVEFTVQAARRITGRPLSLGLSRSYLAAFGSAGQRSREEWIHLDSARQEQALGTLDSLPWDRISAFVLEPGGGTPDFARFPHPDLVQAVARRARAEGCLVVANEITTGLGRTGTWLGIQRYGVEPDLVALGKCLGNGYPVSAALLRREPAERLEATGLKYSQSHQNDPLGAAVAAEVVAELREQGWIERGARLGAAFLERLRALPDPRSCIAEVRGAGMLWALEFRKGCGITGDSAHRFLWERGFVTRGYPADFPLGTGLRFDPALTLPEECLDRLVRALEEMLTTSPH